MRALTCTGLAVGMTLLAASSTARADSFTATRSEKLVEWSHTMDIAWHRGFADVVVQRTAFNGGLEHDQATYFISVPEGAVATRLRTLGELAGRPRWFEGELLEAEAAAARYRELTGIGGYYPKDPALLSWRSQDLLALQVFPCAPARFKTVEYTLRIPTTYADGRERLSLPPLGSPDVPPVVSVLAADAHDQIFADDTPVHPHDLVLLEQGVELSMEYGRPAPLEGALASVPVKSDKAIVSLRIDAAPKLGVVPSNAWVVLAIDASRSFGEEQVRASAFALEQTLKHFEGTGARVRVVTFDRAVRPVTAGFVDVAKAQHDLHDLPGTVANGSHVDAAFDEIARALAAAPPAAPRRAIVLTDFMTRAAVTPERLAQVSARSGAIVHLATVSAGGPQLFRDDDSEWAPVARRTGGVLWHAAASEDASGSVFEEWARPVRIDHPRLVVTGPELDLALPESLDEGQALEHLAFEAGAVHAVKLEGELWSRPIQKAVFADAEHGRRWAGLVFGSPLLYDLTEEEMAPLAFAAGVVSPVTSYLAIEPGVRPSTAGLDWGSGTGSGIGLGRIGTIGHGAGTRRAAAPFDPEAWLLAALTKGTQGCGAVSGASVRVETTSDEIVEVVVEAPSLDAAAVTCVGEAAWALTLVPQFRSSWAEYSVTL